MCEWDHPRSRGVYEEHSIGVQRPRGSSPLARGLPQTAYNIAGNNRIIPARAGFTIHPPTQNRKDQDHPRSRGVYGRVSWDNPPLAGSSPLARGLLCASSSGAYSVRIIPARAGFTPGRQGRAGGLKDHPRSRGVYCSRGARRIASSGSSPLARGLLWRSSGFLSRVWIIPARAGFTVAPGGFVDAPPLGVGIIPARAGFTGATADSTVPAEDHPRSRGVYCVAGRSAPPSRGSSPLARGLPSGEPALKAVVRIIPARAGFTRRCGGRVGGHRDHPRSRGVYARMRSFSSRDWGSSPLARGLQHVDPRAGGPLGIIPARAGFTTKTRRSGPTPKDHPRSRGVYPSAAARAARYLGSSPLARGLRDAQRRRVAVEGIIPARAGFTRLVPGLRAADKDHPRSRGVYGSSAPPAAAGGGSSPLARGLRVPGARRRPHLGIIPARAGFTRPGRAPGDSHRDHPRSRGVYRGATVLSEAQRRIIPARAGFTRRRRRPSSASADHPRSRGVYP